MSAAKAFLSAAVLAGLALASLPAPTQEASPDGDLRASLARVSAALRKTGARFAVALAVTRSDDPEGRGPRGPRAETAEYYSRPAGPCTGTLFGRDGSRGLILTSAWNVSGEVRKIVAEIPRGERFDDLVSVEAKLVGYDKNKDLALLSFDPPEGLEIPEIPKADMKDLKQGDYVFVVGRAPEPRSPTVNYGIVSAIHRHGGTHLQTDAELNYGNVGGPLLNVRGRIVGIATLIRPKDPWGQSGGVGFAFRVDRLEEMIDRLHRGEKIERDVPPKGTAYLGVVPAEGAEEAAGVVVADVLPNSPAERAGIKAGDILTRLGRTAVRTPAELKEALARRKPGQKVKVTIRRPLPDGKYETLSLTVTLEDESEF